MNNVYIMSANRSAIGGFGGTLKNHCPVDLGTLVAKESIARSGFEANEVEHTIFGNVIHTEPRDMYVSRVIALQAGMDKASAALTVNRLCGSGLQAIVSASQILMLGDASVAMAGGVEVMSNGIRVNTIAPGLFATAMLAGMSDEVQKSLIATTIFPKRLGTPLEYAMLVESIVTNVLLNGETIRLDGSVRLAPR